MKVYAILETDLATAADSARRAEELGFDGGWVTETAHDPFLPLVPGFEATEELRLGTAVAIAFPRSPMHLAQTAHDLHAWSGGRFVLGLGSQVRAHVERRFSAEFSHPVARMGELIAAVRAVWRCWDHGERLDFRGDFYELTLMTPYFTPPADPAGPPPIFLAAVGTRMTELAGEAADGLLVHGFSTAPYLRDVAIPALERGLTAAGRSRADVAVTRQTFVVTGRDEKEQAEAARRAKGNLAFYATTPAYRPVLALHGWEDLQDELAQLARRGAWDDMADAIDDEVLDAFALVGEPAQLAGIAHERFGDLLDGLSFRLPQGDPAVWSAVVGELRQPRPATAGQRPS